MTTNPQTQKKFFSKVSHFSLFPGIPTFNPEPPRAVRPSRVAPLVPGAGHPPRAYIYIYVRTPPCPRCASPLGGPCPSRDPASPPVFPPRFAPFSVKGC